MATMTDIGAFITCTSDIRGGRPRILAELIDLGFEYRLQQYFQQFEAGQISLERFADALGLGVRDMYDALEKRNLPTSNIEVGYQA